MTFLFLLAWFFVIITAVLSIVGLVVLMVLVWEKYREVFYLIATIILAGCAGWAVEYLTQYYGW